MYIFHDRSQKNAGIVSRVYSLIRMPVMAAASRTMGIAAAFMAVTGAGCRDLPCDRIADTDSVFRDLGAGRQGIGVYHTGRSVRP